MVSSRQGNKKCVRPHHLEWDPGCFGVAVLQRFQQPLCGTAEVHRIDRSVSEENTLGAGAPPLRSSAACPVLACYAEECWGHSTSFLCWNKRGSTPLLMACEGCSSSRKRRST